MDYEDQKIKQEDFVLIKELITNRDNIVKQQLNDFQNGIINFCKNYNLFQNKTNFSLLSLKEQFEFSECVDYSANKLKKDFKDMEKFYLKCKNRCLDKYPQFAEEIKENIDAYNEETYLSFLKPALNPCVQECVDLYDYLSKNYYKYMVLDKGIYAELIDYKLKLN
jgi:hypothetical protein